jgi:hypothetical protein
VGVGFLLRARFLLGRSVYFLLLQRELLVALRERERERQRGQISLKGGVISDSVDRNRKGVHMGVHHGARRTNIYSTLPTASQNRQPSDDHGTLSRIAEEAAAAQASKRIIRRGHCWGARAVAAAGSGLPCAAVAAARPSPLPVEWAGRLPRCA